MAKKRAINKAVGIGVLFICIVFFVIFYNNRVRTTFDWPDHYFPVGVEEVIDARGKVTYDTLYETITPFNFQTQYGDTLSNEDLAGNLYIADFFFTYCPGVCPDMSSSMQKVQEQFMIDDNVKLVSFSIDPARDSVPRLKEYAARYDAMPNKWFFLRGNMNTVHKLGQESFRISAKKDSFGGFDHGEKFVLVDDRGHIRGYYDGTDSTQVRDLMGDVILLLSELNSY